MPSPGPCLAVIVAAYNSQDFVEGTLASLIGQEFQEWICVVVDDGSTDGTSGRARQVAARDKRISVGSIDHAGVSAARNFGLFSLDTAIPYVMFLDSDDLLLPDAIGTLLGELVQRPDAVGAYGLAEYVDLSGRPITGPRHSEVQKRRRAFAGPGQIRVLRPDEDTSFESLAVYGNMWPPSTAVVKASLARSAGGFWEGLHLLEDWDFFLRLARTGPFVHLDHQVAWYRRRSAAPTGPGGAEYFACVSAVRHHVWASPSTTDEQRRTLLRAHRRQHASAVKERLASLRQPATWHAGVDHVVHELAMLLYALKVTIKGRPAPPDGLLWKMVNRGDRRYGRRRI